VALRLPHNLKQQLEDARIALEIKKCREGFVERGVFTPGYVYFISNYLKIYETRPEYGEGFKPFVLWPRQIEYLNFLEEAYRNYEKEVVVEKCRDMGATYCSIAWVLWHWMFDRHFTALVGTMKEELVRLKPGHTTLFAKLRDFITTLPAWLLPEGFDLNRHMSSLYLENPASRTNGENGTGNVIRGDSSTEKFGRSDRASVCLIDESAFWDDDVSGNLAQTTQLSIHVSTVNGLNFFYDMAQAAKERGALFVFEWWHAEHHTSEWYAKEKALAISKGKLHIFNREIERNYRASVEGQIYPTIANCPRGDYEYNPKWPLYLFWDFGYSDMGYLGFVQRDTETGDLYLIDEVYNERVSIHWYVPFVPGKVVTGDDPAYRYEPEHLEKILEHKSWRGAILHYGDPSGKQKQASSGKSVFDELAKYDIRPACGSGWQNMAYRQQKASMALARLHISNRCTYFYDSFTQFVIPKRADTSTAASTKGVHKWSHAPSAFEAFAISEPAFKTKEQLEQEEAEAIRQMQNVNPYAAFYR
jgi:hypothetical protein